MPTCKNCLHHDVCHKRKESVSLDPMKCGYKCPDFKDRTPCIELPCKMGDKLYIIVTKRPRVYCEKFSFIKQSRLTYCNLERVLKEFGKTVFLTHEDAERALKEMRK